MADDVPAPVNALEPVRGRLPRTEAGRFPPGVSGNPTGRPVSERKLLNRMYGRDGRKVFQRLEALRQDPETPRRLQAQIDMFLIERQFGKAAQILGVESGPTLAGLLAEVAARTTTSPAGDP